VLSAPFWLYQLWAFITPGLKRTEKRYGVGFVAVSTLLFAAGAVLAYISLSKGLQLLLGLAGDGVVVALTAQDYIGFVLSLLVAFGVSFEVPLIAVALNLVGVLPYTVLARSRRWIFFLTIVFSAFITPTQDPFTMLLMAGPMILLFEGAIQIARVVDKRRARREAIEGFHDLSDDEASPLDARPSALDQPLDSPTSSTSSTRG
jgi:sec-independent protein translocase protein TatC